MDKLILNNNKNQKPVIVDNYGIGAFKGNILSEAIRDKNGEVVQGLIVEGPLQRADALNQNGRKYPYKILHREAEIYARNYIKEKRSFGELDHPDSSIVSMQTASHWIQDIWWKGKELWGRVELLDTPCGRIVEAIVKRGLTIGISSRGLGSVKPLHEEDETVEVQDDFEILAWDFVSNPSTQGAFMRPIKESLNEGVTYTKNNNNIYVPNYKFNRVNQLITDILMGI